MLKLIPRKLLVFEAAFAVIAMHHLAEVLLVRVAEGVGAAVGHGDQHTIASQISANGADQVFMSSWIKIDWSCPVDSAARVDIDNRYCVAGSVSQLVEIQTF